MKSNSISNFEISVKNDFLFQHDPSKTIIYFINDMQKIIAISLCLIQL